MGVVHMRAPSGTGRLYLCGSYGSTGDTVTHTEAGLVTCPRCIGRMIEDTLPPPDDGPAKGKKDDGGKPRWDLLPWAEVEEVVKVLTFGAAKYGEYNWAEVPEAGRRYFAAAMRHLVAWEQGDLVDAESGRHHLAHAICCLLFIKACEREGKL